MKAAPRPSCGAKMSEVLLIIGGIWLSELRESMAERVEAGRTATSCAFWAC